jgi:hypothetical protein
LERVRKEAGWVDSLRGIIGSSFSELANTDEAEIRPKNRNAKKTHTHVQADSDLHIEDLVSGDGVNAPLAVNSHNHVLYLGIHAL